MQVNRRCLNTRVPQKVANRLQINFSLQKRDCERVSERMRVQILLEACLFPPPLDQVSHTSITDARASISEKNRTISQISKMIS